jgi:two-component system, OmpR family, phosphate regulon sensor histidine kinase PhoR
MPDNKRIQELTNQVEEWKQQLSECQDTLLAIQTGQVDALVVQSPSGEKIYTLKDAEHPYRVMVETMNEGAATLTFDGTIFYCNNQLATLLKVPLNKIITVPMLNFIGPTYSAAFQSVLQRAAVDTGKAEIELINSEGAAIPVLISARALTGDNEQMISMVVTDLSAQKHTEKIIASERFARTMMEQAADVIVVCDIDGTIIRASEKAQKLIGKALEGMKFDQVFNQYFPILDDDEPFTSANIGKPIDLSAICRGDIPPGSEIALIENSQVKQSFLFNFSPLSEDQNILGYSISLTDITERKKVDQLKDEFIGMVSHELKTPLTVILGALATASDERVSPDQGRELLGDALLHTKILTNLVDNLLELSRQQSDRLIIQTQPLDIGEITRQVIRKHQGKSAKHTLEDDIPTTLPLVLADSIRVEEILNNLIDNAIKYSPEGGVVKVSIRQQGDSITVKISDPGPGISQDNQTRLFQSFERLETRVPGSIQGIGLGLRVCRILVEAQNGKIWVESEIDKGSAFLFTLPVVMG